MRDRAAATETRPKPEIAQQFSLPVAVMLLVAAACSELMVVAFLRWGPLPAPSDVSRFTDRVKGAIAPERDLPIFALGVCFTLAAIGVVGWLAHRRRWLVRWHSHGTVRSFLALLGFGGFVAILSHVAPLNINDERVITHVGPLLLALIPPLIATILALLPAADLIFQRVEPLLPAIATGSTIALLIVQSTSNALVGIVAMVVAGIWTIRCERHANVYGREIKWRPLVMRVSAAAIVSLAIFSLIEGGTTPQLISQWRWSVAACSVVLLWCVDLWQASETITIHWNTQAISWISRFAAFCCVLFVVVCLTISRKLWPGLSGSFFRHDELHHWNFFAFGPALAFAHGQALGSAVYSQYGSGWPMLFAFLRRLVPITYGNMVGTAIWIGTGYFVLLFIFLRLLLRNTGWAMAGTIAAIMLQIFSGTYPGYLLWEYPSSTMLRHPVDVGCFLALLAFVRTKNSFWFLLAAAVTGLATVMELDTGIYLAVMMAFFWLLYVLREWNLAKKLPIEKRPPHFRRRIITLSFSSVVIVFAVWLLGSYLASRGHLWTRDFWIGYFEGFRTQVFSGMGLLPIANVPMETLAPFAAMTMFYLTCIAYGSWKSIISPGSVTRPMFLAAISAYGLGIMLLFVGRSHPWNLLHVTVPLTITMAIAGAMLTEDDQLAHGSGIGWCFAACLIALLLTKPEFADYPNAFNSSAIFARRQIALGTNPPDLAGFKNADRGEVRSFQAIAKTLRNLRVPDQQILVLDERDTLINYLANRTPWTRYTSLFHSLLTWDQVRDLRSQIITRQPMYIVMRQGHTAIPIFNDVWLKLHPTVARYYKLSRVVGDFELWQAKKTK